MKHSKGFTLVEMMVALAIGLFVVAGAVQLFGVTKRNFDELELLSKRQQDIMFISDVISFDIRTAYGLRAYDADELAGGALLSCTGNDAVNEVSGSPGVDVVVAESALSIAYQGLRDVDSSYCVNESFPNLAEVRYFSFLINGSSYLSSCFICESDNGGVGSGTSLANEIFGADFSLSFRETSPVLGGLIVDMKYFDGSVYSFQSTVRDRVIDFIQEVNN